METLTYLIDLTTFSAVRRCLRAADSPITTVMLVQHRATLPRVGAALLAGRESSPMARHRQWCAWLASGEVRVWEPSSGYRGQVDLEAIPDAVRCHVLYLPPVYLVCLVREGAPAAIRTAA